MWRLRDVGQLLEVDVYAEFNHAARDQWQFLRQTDLLDVLTLIAGLILDVMVIPGAIAGAAQAARNLAQQGIEAVVGRLRSLIREALNDFTAAQLNGRALLGVDPEISRAVEAAFAEPGSWPDDTIYRQWMVLRLPASDGVDEVRFRGRAIGKAQDFGDLTVSVSPAELPRKPTVEPNRCSKPH